MKQFPAILIGGPPHSGKSVLVYSLSRALRQAAIPHYVLRACPDGEGDWANETAQDVVRTIRMKGIFTSAFMESVDLYLQKRHLPLLVDVGGLPTAEQEAVFANCTHAVLLIGEREEDPAAFAQDKSTWQQMMSRRRVPIIAELTSRLHGENSLSTDSPVIAGTLAHLERGSVAEGPAFKALLRRISELCRFEEETLTQMHLQQAPAELTLDLPALARTLGAKNGFWLPEHLPALWEYLPSGKPLAVYGRAVNWLAATLTMIAYPAPIWLFDARLGWIQPPQKIGDGRGPAQIGWSTAIRENTDLIRLELSTKSQHLDIDLPDKLPLPEIPLDKGVIISGRLPNWLIAAITRQFAPHVPSVAVYQPQLGGAVVVYSRDSALSIGQQLPMP